MRDLDIKRICDSTIRHIAFHIQNESFKDRETEVFKVISKDRDRFGEIKRDSIFGMTSSTTEDNERAMGFVDLHRFATRRAFSVRERGDFALVRMRKFESTFAIFAEELLVTVFVVTVFVEVGRATLWARRC